MPISPLSGKAAWISYLQSRGLTREKAETIANTLDENNNGSQEGSVKVDLTDGLSADEAAALNLNAADQTDQALIRGWHMAEEDGYEGEGAEGSAVIETDELERMYTDIAVYADAHEITYEQAQAIYLSGEAGDLGRINPADIKATREATRTTLLQEYHTWQAEPVTGGFSGWVQSKFGLPANDPVLLNIQQFMIEHPQATDTDLANFLLLNAFASKFSIGIQTGTLCLTHPLENHRYSGIYDVPSLTAWYKNEAPAAPATAAAAADPVSQTPEQSAQILVTEGRALEGQGKYQEAMDKYLEAYALLDPYSAMALEVNSHVERASALLFPASPDPVGQAETMDFTTDEPSSTGAPAAPITLASLPQAPARMFGGAVGRLEFIFADRPNVSFRIDYQGQTFIIDKNTDPAQVRALLYAKFGGGQEAGIYAILDQVHQMVTGSANSSVWKNGAVVLNLSSMAAHYQSNNYAFRVYYGNEQPVHFPAAATQVAQAPVAVPTSQPETHPGGTLADASTYDVDGGLDYQPSPAEQEIYAQLFADLAADDAPPPATVPVAEAEVMSFSDEEIEAGNLLEQARSQYLSVLGEINSDPQAALPVLQNAASLYSQAIALLPEGSTDRTDSQVILNDINGMIATIQTLPAEEVTTVAAAEAPVPAAEPYTFSDDLVAGELLGEISHPRPVMSTIIHDRQPVQLPAAEETTTVAAAEPAPAYTFDDDLVAGDLLGEYSHPRPVMATIIRDRQPVQPPVAEAPTTVAAAEPALAAASPENPVDITAQVQAQQNPTPEPAPAIVAAAPALVEPPAAPPPPADPLIVNSDYINAGSLLAQNKSFESVRSALSNIGGDFDTGTQLVWDIRSKLAAAADFLHQIYTLPEGDALKGFYGLINNALLALGQAMQTQDTREDDLAALAEVDRLNGQYQEYKDHCDSAEDKYHHNDLAGAVAIYAELAARPDCPSFVSARYTALVAEAGAATQAAEATAQLLAETKAKAVAEYEKLSAFAQEHPELVGSGVSAALEAALTAINALNATQAQLDLQNRRLHLAARFVEARMEASARGSTAAGASQGETPELVLTSAMISSDIILRPNDGCEFPVRGSGNQIMARWNLIVSKILGSIGFQGRIQLQINPATGQLRLLMHGANGQETVKEVRMIPDPAFHARGSNYTPVEGQPGWFNVEYVDNNQIDQ